MVRVGFIGTLTLARNTSKLLQTQSYRLRADDATLSQQAARYARDAMPRARLQLPGSVFPANWPLCYASTCPNQDHRNPMEDRRSNFEFEDLLRCGRGELFGEGPQLPLPPMLMFDRI